MKAMPMRAVFSFLAVLLVYGAAEARTLRLNVSEVQGSPEYNLVERVKKEVEEKTGGELEIKIFPQDQLGNPQTSFESLMNGTLDLYAGALEYYNTLIPQEFSVVSLPFFLKDVNQLRAYLNSPIFKGAEDKLRTMGIRFLSTEWTAQRGPYRTITSSKPIHSLADVEGLKMRMFPNQVAIQAWEHLGAVPIVISWQETYLAIRQGTVSAVTGPLNGLRTAKFTEVAKYVARTNEWPQVQPLAISERVWQTLTPEQQQILIDATNASGREYTREVVEGAEADIEYMKQKDGAEFTLDMDLDPWRERMKSFYPKLIEQGILTQNLYDAVLKLAD